MKKDECENLKVLRELMTNSLSSITKIENMVDNYGNKIFSEAGDLLSTLKELVNQEINRIDNYKIDDRRKINEQYLKYHNNRIKNIISESQNFINSSNNNYYSGIERQILNHVRNLSSTVGDDSIYQLFEQFKYGDSNYILFGKNGSGKTTLLNKLSSSIFNENCILSKATRDINYNEYMSFSPNDITLINALNNNSYGSTMHILSRCVINKELKERREGKDNDAIITNKIIKIYNTLGLNNNIIFDSNNVLKLDNKFDNSYSFSTASDGEKSSLYFIMVTLLAPKDSFLFIDEPENHLNGSLMKKLFDILENERKDIKFIYATHNINFIESRTSSELVYLEKIDKNQKWSFIKYNNFDELPLKLILNVEGTDDDVIFCEGREDGSSLDTKIYSLLFPGFNVISSEGCEKVILQTKIFNKNSTKLRKKAYGIIDYDFRDSDYIQKLKRNNIGVLLVNEIENLLMTTPCLDLMNKFLGNQFNIESIKSSLVEQIKKKQNDIKKDYANKLLRTVDLNNKIDDIVNLEVSLNRLNTTNNELFKKQFSSFDSKLNENIESNNYDELLKYVPGKMIINSLATLFGFVNQKAYTDQLIIQLHYSNETLEALKNYIDKSF